MEKNVELNFDLTFDESVTIYFEESAHSFKTKFSATLMLMAIAHTHFRGSMHKVLRSIDTINRADILLSGKTVNEITKVKKFLRAHKLTGTTYRYLHAYCYNYFVEKPKFIQHQSLGEPHVGELLLPCGLRFISLYQQNLLIEVETYYEQSLIKDWEYEELRYLICKSDLRPHNPLLN